MSAADLNDVALYEMHKSGVLVRESVGIVNPYAVEISQGRVVLQPYGWLRGLLLVLDSPLPNMDASRPYGFTAALHDYNGGPIARSFRVQQICEAVGTVDPFIGNVGERPIL